VLKRFAREIRRKLPTDPIDRLRRKLERAVKSEDYEEAARLRDKIAGMESSGNSGSGKKKVRRNLLRARAGVLDERRRARAMRNRHRALEKVPVNRPAAGGDVEPEPGKTSLRKIPFSSAFKGSY